MTSSQHNHDCSSHHNVTRELEKKTQHVLLVNTVVMVLEIVAGYWSQSLALTADGWHMSSHVAAFLLSIFAFRFARHPYFHHRLMSGSHKVFSFAGFISSLLLIVVAIEIFIESIARLMQPQTVEYDGALIVAIIGLLVNIWSAFVLHHKAEDSNHNIKSAYIHVLADALTSVLAVVALVLGKYGYVKWLDPVMGVLGGIIIFVWSLQLLKNCSAALIDLLPQHFDKAIINEKLHAHGISDQHKIYIWNNPIKQNMYLALCILPDHKSVQNITAEKSKQIASDLGLGHIWFV